MRVLSNKSFSDYRCVEAALPFSAVAQRLRIVQLRNVKCFRKKFLLDGKAAKAHERNFYECPFE